MSWLEPLLCLWVLTIIFSLGLARAAALGDRGLSDEP